MPVPDKVTPVDKPVVVSSQYVFEKLIVEPKLTAPPTKPEGNCANAEIDTGPDANRLSKDVIPKDCALNNPIIPPA
jgi:hypothetical protein